MDRRAEICPNLRAQAERMDMLKRFRIILDTAVILSLITIIFGMAYVISSMILGYRPDILYEIAVNSFVLVFILGIIGVIMIPITDYEERRR